MNLNIGLGEMDSGVTECDDGSRSVGIELIQERELLVTYDALSPLWPILKAHVK